MKRRERKDIRRGAVRREMSVRPVRCHVTCMDAMSPSTVTAARKTQGGWALPAEIGKHSRRVDKALPGKHTRKLYDAMTAAQARVLAQLRTGKIRLNSYLHKIGAAASGGCLCGHSAETVDHFLFRCTRWIAQRVEMQRKTGTGTGCLSFHLGGKAPSDPDQWTPDMSAVQATIKYTMATKRLDEQ